MAPTMTETRPPAQTGTPPRAPAGDSVAVGRLLLFPALLGWLELVLHLAAGLAVEYLPIGLAFALSLGFLLAALPLPFGRRARTGVTVTLTLLLCLAAATELVLKQIFQTFYPLGILQTAAGNRLDDYAGVVAAQILRDLPVLALLFLPALLWLAPGWRRLVPGRRGRFRRLLALGAAVMFHLAGLGLVHLPWAGDLTPAELYRSDTHINDQVEQLGLWTMLRLDVQHMLFPPAAERTADFSALADLEPLPTPTATLPPAPTPAPGQETAPAETPVPALAVDTSPQVLDIDLAALAGSGDADIAWLAHYFASVPPTAKNQYTGQFAGYNVIQLVLEGFSGYALDPELTPTLYKLAHEGFLFTNYYTPLHFTSTSGAECQTLLGLYPKDGSPVTMQRTGVLGTWFPFSLAQQLGRAGYQVVGYHNNVDMYGRAASHSNLGYDWRYYRSGLACEENAAGTDRLWPQRDTYMIETSAGDYLYGDTPFHVYYLTVSGHTPYEWNRASEPYRELVAGLPYSEKTRAYVAAAAIEADRALAALFQRLEEAGQLEHTLIVATGDHIPYADVDVLEELAGQKFGSSEAMSAIDESDIDFSVYKNTLVLWSAAMEEPVQVDKVCCQADILPTVSNLLGLDYDSRMLSGQDILSDSEGLVIFASRCWLSDLGFYDRFTQTFTPAEGVTMTPEEQERYVTAMKQLVACRLDCTELIVEKDFYRVAFGGD